MADLPPTLAALFMTLLSTTDAATQIHDFSTNPAWNLVFAICPETHTNDLNKLMNASPDDILPKTLIPSLIMTVSQWCLDANPSSHKTTAMTGHTRND
jgi:hypothetical protein